MLLNIFFIDSSVAVHDNILLLFNPDHSSEGLYTCTATNVEGQDTEDYFITIKGNYHPQQFLKSILKEI